MRRRLQCDIHCIVAAASLGDQCYADPEELEVIASITTINTPLHSFQALLFAVLLVRPQMHPQASDALLTAAYAVPALSGLSEDEDFEIPGNFLEAMSSNTPLGKALREACKELDHLGGVELEIMNSYDSALAKLGVKSRVAATRTAPQPEEEEEEEAAPRAV